MGFHVSWKCWNAYFIYAFVALIGSVSRLHTVHMGAVNVVLLLEIRLTLRTLTTQNVEFDITRSCRA